jgi:hypothetical protein
MAITGLYIPFLLSRFLASASSRSPHPDDHPHPRLPLRRHISRPRRQSCDQRDSLAPSGLVSLICISILMHPPSGTRRPAPVSAPASLCIWRLNNRALWRLVRGRGRSRTFFVVSWFGGSRQAKFADEVRINETQIKTGRAALMGSPQRGTIDPTRPAPRPQPARFRYSPADRSMYFKRLILFIETRLQTLPCRGLRRSNRASTSRRRT